VPVILNIDKGGEKKIGEVIDYFGRESSSPFLPAGLKKKSEKLAQPKVVEGGKTQGDRSHKRVGVV